MEGLIFFLLINVHVNRTIFVQFPFDQSNTKEEAFFDENGNKLGDVNMMYQKGTFGYAAHAELMAHVLELPYGNENRLSMYILLPRKGKDHVL